MVSTPIERFTNCGPGKFDPSNFDQPFAEHPAEDGSIQPVMSVAGFVIGVMAAVATILIQQEEDWP